MTELNKEPIEDILELASRPKRLTNREAQLRYTKRETSSGSRPVAETEIVLATHQSQRVLTRSYLQLLTDLHTVIKLCRIHGTEEQANDIDQKLLNLFEQLDNAIDTAIRDVQKQRNDNGIIEHKFHRYTDVVKYTVDFTTPKALKYLALIEKHDALCILLDSLWFAGLIEECQRDNAVYDWQKRLFKLSKAIRELADYVNKHVLTEEKSNKKKVGKKHKEKTQSQQSPILKEAPPLAKTATA